MSASYVRLAVPEIRRMAPDALRMLGLPMGQAEEASEAVVWTEAVVGGALRFLRLHSARLLWVPRPRVALYRQGRSAWLVDARGGSLLEFGRRITDFARCEASSATPVTLRVRNTYGAVFVPYLISRVNEHGISVSMAPSPIASSLEAASGDRPEKRQDIDVHMTQGPPVHQVSAFDAVPPDAEERFRVALRHGVTVDEV